MLNQISSSLAQYMQTSEISIIFLLVSFLGGILSSISPCSLGMIPLVVGYVGGYSDTNKFKTFIQLSSFVLGLAVVLTIIGIICALASR